MSHRSRAQAPQGASFRKRNCCWVSGAASVKIAKKPKAERPFAAFFIVNYAGSRCVTGGVLLRKLWGPLSLSLSLFAVSSLPLFLVLALCLSLFLFLSLSLSLSLCRSLFAFSLSLSLLSSLALSSLLLSLSLSLSLALSLLRRSLHRLSCQPLFTAESDYQPPEGHRAPSTSALLLCAAFCNLDFRFSLRSRCKV